MRIVQINAIFGGGSTGRTTKEMHDYLTQNGHESFVFCSNQSQTEENIFCMGNYFSRNIHGVLSRLTGLQGYFSCVATAKLLKKLNQIQPDVVLLRNLHANYIHVNMLLEYLARSQTPTVVVLHDCWLFTGHCCHYVEEKCDKWQRECGFCPAKKKWNKSLFFDRSSRVFRDRKSRFSQLKSLTVVGVSDWVTNECRKSFMKENAKFYRIYNWIDLESFHPHVLKGEVRTKLNLSDAFIVLGVSQSWSIEKGLDIFLKLAKTMPEITIILVGKLCDNLALPSNVLKVGSVDDINELAKYYSAADVFLNPSIQETFGKTTVEAMACGTPVVGYNVTATSELVREGCGYLVEPRDGIEAVIEAIREVRRRGKNYYERNCVSFVRDNFERNRLVEEYISLFRGVCR